MELSKFKDLISKGENQYVDFKIKSSAFSDKSVTIKGELAKDICAMANNGRRLSYIIIGVSDDGKDFRSVDNQKLTDEYLQDFCKDAIFPPPKVKLIRKKWKTAERNIQNKEFVIIKIGPNTDQVFRFYRDFIDYGSKICFRRNEVWIRRNATSDLATPEEILHRFRTGTYTLDKEVQRLNAKKAEFAKLALNEKSQLIGNAIEKVIINQGYVKANERKVFLGLTVPIFWKKIGTQALLLYTFGCLKSISKNDMKTFHFIGVYTKEVTSWEKLPGFIKILTRRRIKAVRCVYLFSSLRKVPINRIEDVFPNSKRTECGLHFYHPHLQPPTLFVISKDRKPLPSSSELLVLDNIKSTTEFSEQLTSRLLKVEKEQNTLFFPKK